MSFRHERNLHGICFYAVASITQLGIIAEEPLFQVHLQVRKSDDLDFSTVFHVCGKFHFLY